MSEARIEAAAKALYKEVHGLNPWEDELEEVKDLFRSDIRMAVSAWLEAGPPVYETVKNHGVSLRRVGVKSDE